MTSSPELILYVADDSRVRSRLCRGSRVCLATIEARALSVQVEHVRDVIGMEGGIPHWLDGTPMLLNTSTGEAFKGSNAIQALRECAPPAAAPAPDAAPTVELQGVLPRGLEHCGEDDDHTDALASREGCDRLAEGKVTEQDLQALIAARNASAPKPVVA